MNRTVVAAFVGGTLALANSALAQDAPRERVAVAREAIVQPRIVTAVPVPVVPDNSSWTRAVNGGASGGGVGGAIGGYYINGTTPMDNRRLDGGAMPAR
jgi:hypothetical protein